MNKLILLVIVSFYFSKSYCQQDILVFKKGNKVISRYWKGTTIAFLSMDKQWQKGEITKIQHDSFYIRPMIVRYNLLDTDTFYLPVTGYTLKAVFAMPNKGTLISYNQGSFQYSTTGGHEHWNWIKTGRIFRVGAAGYVGLHVTNGLINNNFSFSKSKTPLIMAAVVFLGGVFLHKSYKPYLRLGKKYGLHFFSLSN